MDDDFTYKNYVRFVRRIVESGYFIRRANDFGPVQSNSSALTCMLSHDIDASVFRAYKMALIENKLRIKSTYYVMVNNPAYSFTTDENLGRLKKMIVMGHEIGLHYNPDTLLSIEKQIFLFQVVFGFLPETMTVHCPRRLSKKLNGKFKDYAIVARDSFKNYFADSRGGWIHGHPLKSDAFKNKEELAINIHPMWWSQEGFAGGMIPLKSMDDLAQENELSIRKYLVTDIVGFDKLRGVM
jgi:hypothetical protein